MWLEAGFNHACAQDEGLLSSVADLSQAGTPGVADSMADFSWQDRFRRPLRDCASVMIGSVTWDDLDCDSSDDNVQDPNPRPFAATEPEISHLVCVPEEPHSCMTPSSSAGAGCGSPSGSDKKQSVHPSNQFDFDSLAGEADIVCQDICQHEAPDGQTADPPSANDRVRDSMQIHFCSMVGDPEATLGFDLRADSQAETSAELAIMEAYNFCIDQSHGSEEKVGENEQLKSAASPRPEDLSRESEASFLCDATLQDTCVEMNYDDDDSFAAEFGDDTAAAAEAAMSELFGAFSLNSPLPFANKASCSPSATTDVGAPEAPCLSEHASQDIPAHELLPVQPSKPEDIEGGIVQPQLKLPAACSALAASSGLFAFVLQVSAVIPRSVKARVIAQHLLCHLAWLAAEHTPKPDGLQSDSSAAGERILSVLAPPLLEEESETVIRRMADEKSSEDDCNEGEGTAEIAGDEGILRTKPRAERVLLLARSQSGMHAEVCCCRVPGRRSSGPNLPPAGCLSVIILVGIA